MNPSKRRLLKDNEKILKSPSQDGVFAAPDRDSMMKWQAAIYGPDDTPWEGGTFELDLSFPNDYPNHPPKLQFKTKLFHPNIYENGDICVDFLQKEWSKTYDILQILTSIRSLLNDPNPLSPANSQAAQLYLNNRKQYCRRVRQCVQLSWLSKS